MRQKPCSLISFVVSWGLAWQVHARGQIRVLPCFLVLIHNPKNPWGRTHHFLGLLMSSSIFAEGSAEENSEAPNTAAKDSA